MEIINDTREALCGLLAFLNLLVCSLFGISRKEESVKGVGLSSDLPVELPSIVDIKKVIPEELFVPTLSRSLMYATKDVLQVVCAWWVLSYLLARTEMLWLRLTFMILYWAIQGTFFMSIFCLGHDCGHGSFSHNILINDLVGTITHSFLCVPYYPWKLSHHHHHKNTGNIDKDELFYPYRKSTVEEYGLGISRIYAFAFGLGWYLYLLVGYQPRPINHYDALGDPFFTNHRLGCLISVVGVALTIGWAATLVASEGLLMLMVFYIIPLIFCGTYVIVAVFLHHTEVNMTWYAHESWDFVKGQLSTVDRHYGLVHNLIHNIGTHQIHHLFYTIPHYHLEEATFHFRKHFPDLVRICDEPILPSFLRMFRKYKSYQVISDDTLESKYE